MQAFFDEVVHGSVPLIKIVRDLFCRLDKVMIILNNGSSNNMLVNVVVNQPMIYVS